MLSAICRASWRNLCFWRCYCSDAQCLALPCASGDPCDRTITGHMICAGVRFPGLIHPGLIGTAPSQELLDIWNEREKKLVDDGEKAVTLGGILHTRPLGRSLFPSLPPSSACMQCPWLAPVIHLVFTHCGVSMSQLLSPSWVRAAILKPCSS